MIASYIVECSVCSQLWRVPNAIFGGSRTFIEVPDHEMLNFSDSRPAGIPCPGVQSSGMGLGEETRWEQNWPLRKVTRPRPTVYDGSASVHLVTW